VSGYKQLNAWDPVFEYFIRITRRGGARFSKKKSILSPTVQPSHNREKNYIFKEGMEIPPLVDMGIFTPGGKVVNSMYDKYRQVNRFIELIDDEVKRLGHNEHEIYNIIDFGCGKSYLTFLVYYYFTEIKGAPVNIIGMDLKEDVVERCNELSRKYNYERLKFIAGDLKDYNESGKINMVITLHACDTATDFAIYHAIRLGADSILSAPCCQHEINASIDTSSCFSLLLKHGIIKERFSALLTDAIRADLLETAGYRTQIIEFIDIGHTPKNIMLRARKANIPQKSRQAALERVTLILREFNISQTLYTLLDNHNPELFTNEIT
jgi:hypothetical protein